MNVSFDVGPESFPTDVQGRVVRHALEMDEPLTAFLPAAFPHRILLMTVGRTPQVVTETVYALAVAGDAAFVPTEIHLVTTAEGRRQAAIDLFDSGAAQLARLCGEYGLDRSAIRFDDSTLHVVSDARGPLDDIRSVADNDQAADHIVQLVRRLTTDADAALHVSLAGGRKTMGFYLGYALSLFGRPQDRLSHVLVDSDFESHPDFFYPTASERLLRLRDKRTVDAQTARVTLARIPYVSLRGRLGAEILGDNGASYGEIVRRASAALDAAPLRLRIDLAEHGVRCGDAPVKLSAAQFAWYAWFAWRAKLGEPGVNWRSANVQELTDIVKAMEGPGSGRVRAENWRGPDGVGVDKAAFERVVTRINHALRNALGAGPATPYLVTRSGPHAHSVYGLNLAPAQIEFAA